MKSPNPNVDVYFVSGCGRCALFDTPQCKVHKWREALLHLRMMLLESSLEEELKWGVPCYTLNKKNVILLGAYNDSCVISFLKGNLLPDPQRILIKAGENSQIGRIVRFTNIQQVLELQNTLQAYIQTAIEIEKSGAKVEIDKSQTLAYPDELTEILAANPDWKKAFEALTPGRQRGYLLYFTAAKQPKTRESRILKYIPKILEGKGMHD